MTERVVVVISADLAHTHLSSGPYGYSNTSEPFDLVRNVTVAILTVLYYAMKIVILTTFQKLLWVELFFSAVGKSN